MKAKSLSVFRTKLRRDAPGTELVNIGDIIEGDNEHLCALARNHLVELIEDDVEGSAIPLKTKIAPEAKPVPTSRAAVKPSKGTSAKPTQETATKVVDSPTAAESREGNE